MNICIDNDTCTSYSSIYHYYSTFLCGFYSVLTCGLSCAFVYFYRLSEIMQFS